MFFVMFLWCCFMLFHVVSWFFGVSYVSCSFSNVYGHPRISQCPRHKLNPCRRDLWQTGKNLQNICQNMSKLSHIRWNILQCHWSSWFPICHNILHTP
jgi:hypothetical protein